MISYRFPHTAHFLVPSIFPGLSPDVALQSFIFDSSRISKYTNLEIQGLHGFSVTFLSCFSFPDLSNPPHQMKSRNTNLDTWDTSIKLSRHKQIKRIRRFLHNRWSLKLSEQSGIAWGTAMKRSEQDMFIDFIIFWWNPRADPWTGDPLDAPNMPQQRNAIIRNIGQFLRIGHQLIEKCVNNKEGDNI